MNNSNIAELILRSETIKPKVQKTFKGIFIDNLTVKKIHNHLLWKMVKRQKKLKKRCFANYMVD